MLLILRNQVVPEIWKAGHQRKLKHFHQNSTKVTPDLRVSSSVCAQEHSPAGTCMRLQEEILKQHPAQAPRQRNESLFLDQVGISCAENNSLHCSGTKASLWSPSIGCYLFQKEFSRTTLNYVIEHKNQTRYTFSQTILKLSSRLCTTLPIFPLTTGYKHQLWFLLQVGFILKAKASVQ